MNRQAWWWCSEHGVVENCPDHTGDEIPKILGSFPTAERAAHVAQMVAPLLAARAADEIPKSVRYVLHVPVYVELDLTTLEVERVVVDDENPVDGWFNVRRVEDVDGNRLDLPGEVVAGLPLVADDQMWPAWEFGW